MSAIIIDGVAIAKRVKEGIAAHALDMKSRQGGIIPGLAVILVGDDPASQVYVRNKNRACEEVGFRSYAHTLPASTTELELLALIAELNNNPQVNGILVQLPLPDHINERTVINTIDPIKDVDGFHPVNIGRLSVGLMSLAPCTPSGCMFLLNEIMSDLGGKKALVVGRSNIVGKPMASMLLQASCTVTVAHSRTLDLRSECKQADILVAALGKPGFIKGDWIKEGAIVIDVGINRVVDPVTGKSRLQGDVEFEAACKRARAITPVPGGVGPMTIACLLQNTLQATMMQNGWGW
ncbi:MAG: bifunctional methylenetetrahydrofolate dehydrogenase/methenyltetrahydrofolate cyclohydrolase FolD [Proteobacteria bacterium]|jgi:methylenetetrahydrofolate dehydrogenase (NADP+)/methenyltetrahydrofolate cyclohydrolase|nr:bifunctional methylenetetrahydrofolate dehydrogenase/methenyltetrahydrofolate cyclohydrolase FolD [Alphaproteobacteria bacterium]NCC02691.1 bifunctional methylenetetrahydrofolate dehydrogenase/methenyltetrahydrofolate cyclohydrolase FolD [Pseudomonadota bacterium]